MKKEQKEEAIKFLKSRGKELEERLCLVTRALEKNNKDHLLSSAKVVELIIAGDSICFELREIDKEIDLLSVEVVNC